MFAKIVTLNPQATPKAFYREHEQELDKVPDGTGLQILFKINGENYILAGPRSVRDKGKIAYKLLTLNGGKIEHTDRTFLSQISEEFLEETFGTMNVEKTEQGYRLILSDGSKHPLSLLENHSFVKHSPGKYTYVTFTATCETMTLPQLTQLAAHLTPTAAFWNTIGNYLLEPQNGPLIYDWQSDPVLCQLQKDYQGFNASNPLLTDPNLVFETQNFEEVLKKLYQIKYHHQHPDLKRKVGSYSERPAYHVFKTSELVYAASKPGYVLKDIEGQVMPTTEFLNRDVVLAVLPSVSALPSQAPALASEIKTCPVEAKLSALASAISILEKRGKAGQQLIKSLQRLQAGKDNHWNPYWMNSSAKLDYILLAIQALKENDDIETLLKNKESSLYIALNMQRITPITFLGSLAYKKAKTLLFIEEIIAPPKTS